VTNDDMFRYSTDLDPLITITEKSTSGRRARYRWKDVN
jgi:hypothetical protein